MVEIKLDMDYLYNDLLDIRKSNKLQLDSCGILDCDNVKNLEMKSQDGKIVRWSREVEEVLYIDDLAANDLSVGDHIDTDEELSESLNDCEPLLFAKYNEI